MKSKIFLVSLLVIFCLSIGVVCAEEIDDNVVLSENENLMNDSQ